MATVTPPPNINYGTVQWQALSDVNDGPDADQRPDFIAPTGTVTFTASVNVLRDITANPNAVSILRDPIVGVLDPQGYLCTPNEDGTPAYRGVQLIATDDTDLNPTEWTYTVSYTLRGKNGRSLTVKSHQIYVSMNTTVDLSKVGPVDSATEISIPQAEALAAEAQEAAAAAQANATTAQQSAAAAQQSASVMETATDANVAQRINTGTQTKAALSAQMGALLSDHAYAVIPVLGQSNSVGAATGYDIVRLDPPHPRIDAFPAAGQFAGQIVKAGEPMADFAADAAVAGTVRGMSFALGLAKRYLMEQPPNRRVLLVPCGYGGTGFSTPDSKGGTRSWSTSATGADSLLNNAIATIQAALSAAGPDAFIPMVCWQQGEQDAANGRSTAQYAADFDAMLTALRAALGLPTVPVTTGRFNATMLQYGSSRNIDDAIVESSRRNTRVGVAQNAGLGYGDPVTGEVHYSAAGQRILASNHWDAYRHALANVTGTPPVAPDAPTLTQSGTTVTATWAAPLGRSTDYNVRYSTDGGATWTMLTRSQSVALSASITGLSPGASVQVQVRSVNETGASAWSPAATLTMKRTPNAPTGLTAGTAVGNSQPLTWTASTTDSTHDAASAYLVEYKPTSGGSWTTFGTVTATSATVTGLAYVTSYDYRGTGVNAGGTGGTSGTVTASTGTVSDMTTGLIRKWSAASVTGVSNGSAVASVPESTGTAGAAAISQATSNAQPTLKTNGVNGKPTLVFDGVNDFLADSAAPYTTNGAETVVAILKHTGGTLASGTAVPIIGSGQNPRQIQVYNPSSGNVFTINAGTLRNSGVSADGGFHMVAALFSDTTTASGTAYADGTSVSGSVGSRGRSGVVLAGTGSSGSATPTTFSACEIAEVRVYDHQLTTSELAALRTYFQQVYATP